MFGLERGYCMMIGGEERTVAHLDPIFRSLAPGVEMAARTPGRRGPAAQAEHGYLHCGGHGAGHFVKMVHNGIEYGLMAAYAEGLAILKKADIGLPRARQGRRDGAAARPRVLPVRLRHWPRSPRSGGAAASISSWLLDLTAAALHEDPDVASFSGHVSDSGEGRWTVLAAIDEAVPAHVLASALYERFSSRGEADYADKLLSALRKQFGGHVEQTPPA